MGSAKNDIETNILGRTIISRVREKNGHDQIYIVIPGRNEGWAQMQLSLVRQTIEYYGMALTNYNVLHKPNRGTMITINCKLK